jgi:hypothetical protein
MNQLTATRASAPAGAWSGAAPVPPSRTSDQVVALYPFMRRPIPGGDLTRLPERRDRAYGQIINLVGRVLDRWGAPVPRAKLSTSGWTGISSLVRSPASASQVEKED